PQSVTHADGCGDTVYADPGHNALAPTQLKLSVGVQGRRVCTHAVARSQSRYGHTHLQLLSVVNDGDGQQYRAGQGDQRTQGAGCELDGDHAITTLRFSLLLARRSSVQRVKCVTPSTVRRTSAIAT